jgi:eukaryotic-like serine/threonine-protein kinase
VVADFGIARAAYEESLTASGELLGTASYIAPEQAMGDATTAASDRYSLAVVAYELITGGRPFAGPSFAEQALQQVESEPDPPSLRAPGLSPRLDAVLLRGLAKDADERWETAGAFAGALGGALEGSQPPPPPPPPRIDPEISWPHEPTTAAQMRRLRRRAGPLVGLAAGALALVIAVVVLLSSGGDGGSDGGQAGNRAERSTAKKPKKDKRAKPQPAQRSPSTPAPSTTSPSTTEPSTPEPSAPPTGGGSPDALNDQGFALMNQGRYDEAIPVLERAVAGFPEGSRDLTLAYALYNLGRSLRLAGRPGEAIPYLERRLEFNNQRGVVRRELAAARAAAR